MSLQIAHSTKVNNESVGDTVKCKVGYKMVVTISHNATGFAIIRTLPLLALLSPRKRVFYYLFESGMM